MTEPTEIQRLREKLETDPLEDVVEAVRAQRSEIAKLAPDALATFEDDLCSRIADNSDGPWTDRKKAARAFLYCLDVALERGRDDGDTRTWALVRALEQDPADDALLADYTRAVSDTSYRYTGLSLAEIASRVEDPDRKRWLAALDTIVEYFCLRDYLDPPQAVYVDAQTRSFARALACGMDEGLWRKAREWVLENVPLAKVPEGLFARYAKA